MKPRAYVPNRRLALEMRSLDRISDAQLMAAEGLVFLGLSIGRIAARLGVEEPEIRKWFRDPVFIAACNELTRSFCAGQLVPLGLFQVRRLLNDPFLKMRDAATATKLAAELAGLYATGAAEAGEFAPGAAGDAAGVTGKAIAEMSPEELRRAMVQGMAAQRRLTDAIEEETQKASATLD